MEEKEKEPLTPDEATEKESPNDAETATFAESAEEGKEEKEPKKKVRHLEAELAKAEKKAAEGEKALEELNDRYLRLAAEYDNFRKRNAKERENLYADALSDALAAFLPMVDNLERAAAFSDGESLAKGIAMVLRGAEETLGKLGVTEIEALGKPFDPALHNAVMHIEDPALGENTVAEVLQKGYMKGDRVLRYAMVKVAN